MSLPPDLSALGEHFERAARRAIRRRRRLRAARTAVAATAAALAFGAVEPADLAAPVRWATEDSMADLAAIPHRCVALPTMRNEACRDWQAFVSDAAAGPESPTVIAYAGDATQIGSSDPVRPPGVRIVD